MKLRHCLVLAFALLASASAFAQPSDQNQTQPVTGTAQKELTKFNLDFPGGTPGELVAAIEKATGRPLNAIIPTEDAARQLPPLKMSGVNVAQLFNALIGATTRPSPPFANSRYGFVSLETQPTDDSIWYFFVEEPQRQPTEAQFYLLTPYLQRGLTVDDITTAIQTAWKMQGGTRPTMSFHKETNLLIAVGDPVGLQTINSALSALQAYKAAAEPAPKSGEKKE